jgi:uncharacterized protein YdaT
MPGKNQHIVPHKNGWAVKGEGNERPSHVTKTKQEAVYLGRQIAANQGSELIIHGKDGKIQAKDSHGRDPYPPKG